MAPLGKVPGLAGMAEKVPGLAGLAGKIPGFAGLAGKIPELAGVAGEIIPEAEAIVLTNNEKHDAALNEYCKIIREQKPFISKSVIDHITKLFDDLKEEPYTSEINDAIMGNILNTINTNILKTQYTQRAFIFYIIKEEEIKDMLRDSILNESSVYQLGSISRDRIYNALSSLGENIFNNFNNSLSDPIRKPPPPSEQSSPPASDQPPSKSDGTNVVSNQIGGQTESANCVEIAELFPKDEPDEEIRSDITTIYKRAVYDVLNSKAIKNHIKEKITNNIENNQLNDTINSFVLNKPHLNKSILHTLLNPNNSYVIIPNNTDSPSITDLFKEALNKALRDNIISIASKKLDMTIFVTNMQKSFLDDKGNIPAITPSSLPSQTLPPSSQETNSNSRSGGKRRTRRNATKTTTTRRKYNRRRVRTTRNKSRK